MSDDDDIRRKKASRTKTSLLVWVLLAMVITGLGGFGITNFGRSVTAIGSVGDVEIEANAYARALRAQVNRLSQQFGQQLTLEEARMFGIDQQVLSGLIANAALDNEAQRVGVSVGDGTLAQKVAGEPAFADVTGKFDAATYTRTLEQAGMTIKDYETSLRADIARSVLQAAIVGGATPNAALADALVAYAGETRSFTLLPVTAETLPTPPAAPTEDELKAYYDTKIDLFTRAEGKRLSYVTLRPADLASAQAVPPADVEALYNERKSEFVVPEKRLVERLVYPTEAEAQAAKARLDAGETFETLVADRKLELADIDLGDVTKAELGAAGDAVFALTEPGVTGPVQTDLGPALFRMNAILPAQETTLDEARADLTRELAEKAAVSAIADQAPAIDDALAGGATLDDLARDFAMAKATTDFVAGDADNDPITADPAFAAAAAKVAEGDFPELLQLADGGIAALQLDEVVPPTPLPFDKVRDRVAEALVAERLTQALTAQAEALNAAVTGGADLASQGTVTTITGITRDATPEGATPDVVSAAFTMAPGEVKLIDTPGFVGLIRLDAVTPVDPASEDAKARRAATEAEIRQGFAADAYDLYTQAMTTQGGLSIDQTVISSVQSQMR